MNLPPQGSQTLVKNQDQRVPTSVFLEQVESEIFFILFPIFTKSLCTNNAGVHLSSCGVNLRYDQCTVCCCKFGKWLANE